MADRTAATHGVKATAIALDLAVAGGGERLAAAITARTRLAKTGAPMSSVTVADMGYRAWQENRAVIVTGTRNAMVAGLVRFLPKRAVLAMVYRLQSPS